MEPLEIEIPTNGTSTEFESLFKLLKCAIGSGIFAIPYAYMQCGLYTGLLMQVMTVIFTFLSWCTMIDCIEDTENLSLIQWLKKYHRDSLLEPLTSLITTILIFGCGVSYIIVFNETVAKLLQYESTTIKGLLASVLFAAFIIASFKEQVTQFNVILQFSLLFVSITIAYLIFIALQQEASNAQQSSHQIMLSFGIILFSYDINGILTEIRQEMREPQKFKFVLFASMVIESVVFAIFGIICWHIFGENTNEMVIVNFQQLNSSLLTGIIAVCYSCTLIVSAMVMNTPLYVMISSNYHDTSIQIIIKIVYISSQIGVANLYPNFARVLSLLGCFCSVTLGYILPFILTRYKEQSLNRQIYNMIILSFGIIGGCIGVYESI